jgi:dsRNA-specific ribonuclease
MKTVIINPFWDLEKRIKLIVTDDEFFELCLVCKSVGSKIFVLFDFDKE